MSQLIDNLNLIVSIKSDIKSAIENKGVDMTGVSFPGYASKIGEISGGGGWDQKSITEKSYEIINLDNSASFVASSAFRGNQNIQTVNLPYATTVGNSAFQSCSSLSQVDLPMCSYIGSYAFYRCSSLSQISLPVCSYIDDTALGACSSLSKISLPVCSYIESYAFGACSSLNIITIGYSSVCNLPSSNIFINTQITSSTGSIYVPTSLVDAYKSAPNWSYFSTQIFPIE